MYSSSRRNILPGSEGATLSDLKVYEPSLSWKRQQEHWELIEALTEGTLAMQRYGRRYLPAEPLETDEAYKARLHRSVCPPYLIQMERMLAGMLSRKPVRLDDVPDVIREHLFDADLAGNDLNVFVNHLARMALRYGHVGVLVDFPKGDEGDETPVSQFNRPYWSMYRAPDILGWRTDVINGTQKLSQLRLLERVVVPYQEFGEEIVEQVRVLEPGRYRVYRKQGSQGRNWDLISEGTMTLDEIPFAVAYSNRTGFMESVPPLEEIAWLNLKAYRCESDQSNLLHVAAVPRYNLFGVPAELDEIEAGPGSAMAFPVDARAEFTEPQGTSYEARFRELERIERQINQLGLAAVLGQKFAAETAESKRIERSQGDAALMTVALQLQDLIDNCLRFHANFLGLPQAGRSMVNTDFVSQRMEPAEIGELLKLRQAGEITQETLLIQLADGEIFYDDFDVDAEIEATAAGLQARMKAREADLQGAIAELSGNQVPAQEAATDIDGTS